MGVLDWFRKQRPTTVDPIFDPLTFDKGWWVGQVKRCTVLYEPMREHLKGKSALRAEPTSAAGMLTATTLDEIYLLGDGRIELMFAFIPDVGWDAATLRIGLEDWKPVPLSLDD